MTRQGLADKPTTADQNHGRAAAALVTDPLSEPWRRRLGPLAWVALEHLALSSYRTDEGWVAPVGVRHVAEGIGVTKDTAARALATLAAVELVVRTRVEAPDGRRRTGYQLNLPEALQLFDCPVHADTPRTGIARCPEGEYEAATACPKGEYEDHSPVGVDCMPHQDSGVRRESNSAATHRADDVQGGSGRQPTLFDTSATTSRGSNDRMGEQ